VVLLSGASLRGWSFRLFNSSFPQKINETSVEISQRTSSWSETQENVAAGFSLRQKTFSGSGASSAA
jgi:hypothetical protein